jgi:hypothetical protein
MSSSLELAERIAQDLTEALQKAEASIASLVEERDAEQLSDVRSAADAQRLFEERSGANERAVVFAKIKLLAEAGLGALTFIDYPTLRADFKYPDGVRIGKETIRPNTARRWRLLAHAQERGLLLPVIDDLSAAEQPLGTAAVADECGRRGVAGVPAKILVKKLREKAALNQVTLAHLAQQVGIPQKMIYEKKRIVRWENAKALAEALGVDPLELPLARQQRQVTRKRLWLKRERKKTGGRWDETYSRFRRCLDEFASVAGEGHQWDEAYQHFYALEEIIGRAMKRESSS